MRPYAAGSAQPRVIESRGTDHGEGPGPSVKDDKLYESLRNEGESKEKAARIANAKAGGTDVNRKGGEGGEGGEGERYRAWTDRSRNGRGRVTPRSPPQACRPVGCPA